MRVLAAAAVLAACGTDPALHVTVTHPSDVVVASTTVSIYETSQFSCQDIEYGNVDEASLAAAEVASETVDTNGATGALTGLSRTDTKLVVARGYDAGGSLLAAGCAEQGVVSGDVKLAVTTEAAAVVSYALVDPSGQNDLYGIQTTVTDASGKGLDGRQVWWRAYGPAGTGPLNAQNLTTVTDGVWEPTMPSCTKLGLDAIHPIPPSLIGGFAVELRVAWAVASPPLFSSFTKLDPTLTQLVPPAGAKKYCTRHVASSGSPTLTCLDGGTIPVAYDFTVTSGSGSATLSPKASTPSQSVPATTIDLYGVTNGSKRDVYAATSTCSITGLFGATANPSTPCAGLVADDVMIVPACGSAPAKLLFHSSTGIADKIYAIPPTGGAGSDLSPGFILARGETHATFNAAGCVTELDPSGGTPTLSQVIVLDYANAANAATSTRALYNCNASGMCSAVELPLPQAGVGFTGGSESRLVMSTVDATGVVLSQDVLLPDPGGAADHLVERSRQPSASIPQAIVAGKFDDDDGIDLLWDIATKRGTSFQIAYARTVNGEPLSALSPAQPSTVQTIEVGDVTGDGRDDVVVIGQSFTTTPTQGVAVIPTQVPPANGGLVLDSKTCAP